MPRLRGIRIALFILCGAFALAAAFFFRVQWNEGETAAQNAEMLLKAAGINPAAAVSTAEPQPDARAADTGGAALPAGLQGYSVMARLDIDVLNLHLPVLSETTEQALKASVCYYTGPVPGGEGNLVITGHNYRSGAHFGRLDELAVGDTLLLTDREGKTYTYAIYKLEHIKPDDSESLNNARYNRELSLITCEANGNGRLLVRCAVEAE